MSDKGRMQSPRGTNTKMSLCFLCIFSSVLLPSFIHCTYHLFYQNLPFFFISTTIFTRPWHILYFLPFLLSPPPTCRLEFYHNKSMSQSWCQRGAIASQVPYYFFDIAYIVCTGIWECSFLLPLHKNGDCWFKTHPFRFLVRKECLPSATHPKY